MKEVYLKNNQKDNTIILDIFYDAKRCSILTITNDLYAVKKGQGDSMLKNILHSLVYYDVISHKAYIIKFSSEQHGCN